MSPRTRPHKANAEILNRLAAFGGLLSKKQRLYAELHHHQGLSLAEIARRYGVSRQAVLCTLQHAEARLQQIADYVQLNRSLVIQNSSASEEKSNVVMRLRQLRDRVAYEGIIYSTDWIVRELDDAIAALEQ